MKTQQSHDPAPQRPMPNDPTMQESLLDYLACPACGSEALELVALGRQAEEINTGALRCGCGRTYPIQEGIARMLPDALAPATEPPPALLAGAEARGREGEGARGRGGDRGVASEEAHDSILTTHDSHDVDAKRREMQARDAQVGDYDRMWYLTLFGRVEIPLTLKHLKLRPEHALLEAGCGTGRMTPAFAARCKQLVSVDFSWESLRACAAKLQQGGARNVALIQADICRLPLRAGAFDRVVSCQVLEHIPTPESRAAAVQDLARVLRPGGNLVLSAYQYSLWMRLFGQKEGEHAGGIYFYRFDRRELRRLLAGALTVEAMTGALLYHYIARCRKAG